MHDKQAASSSSLEERSDAAASKHALAAAELAFQLAVEPLEAKAHRRLSGPGRTACLAAFAEAPEAFGQLAADALRRGRNPLGLLCRMVAEGDHALGEARELTFAEQAAAREAVREAKWERQRLEGEP